MLTGVWGERRRSGEVWVRDQIPAASVQTGICYLGNWGGKICATLFIFVHSFRDAHSSTVHLSDARFFKWICDHPFLILIYCISNLWNYFRSVRHLRQHSQTFLRVSVMMTATPPLMPRPPHQWRAQGDSTEPNPASPNAEPINRTQRPSTSQ